MLILIFGVWAFEPLPGPGEPTEKAGSDRVNLLTWMIEILS